MTFANTVKGREIAYVTRLLNIFGVVEQRQLRSLFSHMSDGEYGLLLSRLNSEGMICWLKDGTELAASRLTAGRRSKEKIRCFWAFIRLKDKIRDFCAADPPALASILTSKEDCLLIPVTDDNSGAINAHAASLPDETIRFFVARSIQDIDGIVPRGENDYVLLIDDAGATETYEYGD